jgi:hypothetical protein
VSRYGINDRIRFDMAVEEARAEAEGRRKGGFPSVVAESVRLSGGSPSWMVRSPKRRKIMRGRQ